MNKNTLASIVIAGSMLATPLFASNFFHKLMPVKQSVHLAPHLYEKSTAKHHNQNYTDFSGSWSGRCTVFEDNDTPMTVTIENDDEYFNIDGEELKIGPLHTETTSDNQGATFEHTSLEWSNDMSMLTIKNLHFDKVHSLYPHNESKPMVTIIGQFTLSLNNDEQLVIKGNSIALIDLEQKGEFNNFSCTLSKE